MTDRQRAVNELAALVIWERVYGAESDRTQELLTELEESKR
jgi:hypothetical protein